MTTEAVSTPAAPETEVQEETKPGLPEIARRALALVDLTSLGEDDTDEKITQLCEQARTKFGGVAAVCVFPKFVKLAKTALASEDKSLPVVKVATVANFPAGSADVDLAVKETASCVEDGADEVDVVFPYNALKEGDEQIGRDLVSKCKEACKTAETGCKLKVIIESGELDTSELIQKASTIALESGADFIKTSTGKQKVSATPEAARTMLQALKAFCGDDAEKLKSVGFKAAGGVRTTEQAGAYLSIADEVMGSGWATADTFRFGASGLLGDLLKQIESAESEDSTKEASVDKPTEESDDEIILTRHKKPNGKKRDSAIMIVDTPEDDKDDRKKQKVVELDDY